MKRKYFLSMVWSQTLLVVLLTVAVDIGAAQATDAVSRHDFKSKWLKITGGGMTGEKGGKPVIILQLKNKKRKPLWVKVHFDVPGLYQDCEATKKFMPKGKAFYDCPQEEIVADTDYPILINIYSDENLTSLVEENSTKMKFSKRDVDALLAWLAPPALPATFKDVVHTEKPGIGASMFGQFKKHGTLVIHKNNIEYTVQKGKSIAIPFSKMRAVSRKQLGPRATNVWVIVEYQDADENKTIGFQASALRGDPKKFEEAYSTLKYVYDINR